MKVTDKEKPVVTWEADITLGDRETARYKVLNLLPMQTMIMVR